MNEDDIELYDPKEKYEVEIELIDKDNLIDYIKEHPDWYNEDVINLYNDEKYE